MPDEVLAEFLGLGAPTAETIEAFWTQVGGNLKAGRLRLVFAADQIPAELRRIVEFLNAQMDPTDVLAVEVRRFVGDGHSTLVPKVIGHTAASDRKNVAAPRRDTPWIADEFIRQLAGRSAEEVSATKGIIAWAHRQGLQESGGTGGKVASLYFRLKLPKSGVELEPAYLYVGYRRALLYLQIRSMGPAFQSRESRVELGTVLRDRAGLDSDTAKEYPGVPLSELYDPARMERLLGVLDWVLKRMRETDQETQPNVSGE